MTATQSRSLFVFLMTVHVGLLLFTSWTYSPVIQEPCQLIAGVTSWKSGRYDLFHVNPPFVRLAATLPVVCLSPNYDEKKFDREPIGREEYSMAREFLTDNPDRARLFFFLARVACIPFSLVGASICWRWSCKLFGPSAGIVAATLWCFCPFVLGNSSTIMTDVPSAAMGVLTVYLFWNWLSSPSWKLALFVGVALGIAALTKFTLLLLYPLIPVLFVVFFRHQQRNNSQPTYSKLVAMQALMVLVSLFIINLGYGYEGTLTPLHSFRFQSKSFAGRDIQSRDVHEVGNRFAGTWLGSVPMPLPANFIQGIDTQKVDFELGLPSYLRGEWADHGWWYYYLYAMAIKLPLGTIALVFLAAGLSLFSTRYSSHWRHEGILITSFLVILAVLSCQSGFSVHSRYLIPALPFLFIWTGKVALVYQRPFQSRWKSMFALAAGVLLFWSTVSSLTIYPNSLSYFNELTCMIPVSPEIDHPPRLLVESHDFNVLGMVHSALTCGPTSGPRHLLDSNIDWSQDLFELERWYLSNPDARPLKVAYSGTYPIELTQIRSAGTPPAASNDAANDKNRVGEQLTRERLSPPQLEQGWYAISVNELFGRSSRYKYFLEMQPAGRIGYSFYLFKQPPPTPPSSVSTDRGNEKRPNFLSTIAECSRSTSGIPGLPQLCAE